MTDAGRPLRRALIPAALLALALGPCALAQTTADKPAATEKADPNDAVGGWPKVSFDTLASLEYAGMSASGGPHRGPDVNFRADTTLLVEFDDALSLDGLFQIKSRSPISSKDPNRDLFTNQGAGRNEGGKMKELYFRYGDYRFGKFVQDFGRAYAQLASPFADDFVAEPEEGYEPSDMVGIERLHVFDDEGPGWRQISVSAFMVDPTFLHQSLGYNEGMSHLNAGGVGVTRYPENIMLTYDVYNQPVGHGAQASWQASAIRWGRTYGSQASEFWTTLGGDITIPLRGTVADTLRGDYTQVRFYVEAARRDNFNGFAGRARNYLSASVEYTKGPLVLDLTTSQRWTTDKVEPLQTDALYTASIGYTLPSQTLAALAFGQERVGDRQGVYAGLRLTQTLTNCSKCIAKGKYY